MQPVLHSAGGMFRLDLALLVVRDEPEDIARSHAIHEYAHASMLAGSRYYASYASRAPAHRCRGERVDSRQ